MTLYKMLIPHHIEINDKCLHIKFRHKSLDVKINESDDLKKLGIEPSSGQLIFALAKEEKLLGKKWEMFTFIGKIFAIHVPMNRQWN
jgi:hypothetical protein